MTELPQTIIFDTNFLLIPNKYTIDIFEETERVIEQKVRFAITKTVLDEIQSLKKNAKPSLLRELEFAELLAKKCTIIDIQLKCGETVDDSIIRVATNKNYIVGTNDSKLRKKLREHNIPVLVMRNKSYLIVEGFIP